ncbi:MAG TPA: hypothetical protein VMN36_04115 [Verrucomicrobiales bacterium]|nr:hypothetical protein [Verrucomicrobiales bacterium]
MEGLGNTSGLTPSEHSLSWALRLAPDTAPSRLAPLRNVAGVLAGAADGRLWLRGIPGTTLIPLAVLSRIPVEACFVLDPEGRLTPPGARLPAARLPEISWFPLRDWLVPTLTKPVSAPNRPAPAAPLQLIPDPAPFAPPNLLLASLNSWRRFCQSAPALRLAPLRFAASAQGEVLVLGAPIPAIPGLAFHLDGRIALPCGWMTELHVTSEALARRFRLPPASFALLRPDRPALILSLEDFVQASRSAARLTCEHLALRSSGKTEPS